MQLTPEQCGCQAFQSQHSQILSTNLTTNSLLLSRSLTNNINSQLTHILYDLCFIYYILKIKQIVIKKIIRKIKQLIVYKSINWKKIHV